MGRPPGGTRSDAKRSEIVHANTPRPGSGAFGQCERAARVLRQPALVNFIQAKLNDVSPEMRNEPLVKDVSSELPELEKLVSFPAAKAPTADDVKKVNEAVGKIMTQIQTKEESK